MERKLAELEKADKKPKDTVNVSLVALLDHENFCLYHKDPVEEMEFDRGLFDELKEDFVVKMQQIYEDYTAQVISKCLGENFETKIE